MLQMKPIVPKTRIGGKALTGSLPAFDKALNATELEMAIVGMKNARLKEYSVKSGPNWTAAPALRA